MKKSGSGQVFFKNEQGFTLVEVLFVAVISAMVIATILGTWIFAYNTWTVETERTNVRIDLIQALETIRNDLRLSSLTYISFYPNGAEPYSAISLPVAVRDANGFFSLNADGEIDWDRTVIYHLSAEADGTSTLRRTVFDPRDNTMDETERDAQLTNVVTSGTGGVGSTTDTAFLKNVETFEISSIAPVIDFYYDSSTPVREGKVVFGWAKLAAGDHQMRLEITGKNASSGGYAIGLDSIMIEPSGSEREVEYYDSSFAPAGMLTLSGGSAARVHDTGWGNENYLEFDAGGVGSYIEIEDYYDLWRESSFGQAALDNTWLDGEEVRATLDLPQAFDSPAEAADAQDIIWYAYQQTGDAAQEGTDGYVNSADPTSAPGQAVVVRVLLKHDDIDLDPAAVTNMVDLVRIKFKAASAGELRIERAYITRMDMTSGSGYDGLVNLAPGGKTIDEYHLHQQLFFKDISDIDGDGDDTEVIEQLVIDPTLTEREAWSEWTAFPVVIQESGTDIDYLVTFLVLDPAKAECTYWDGSTTNVYCFQGDYTTDFEYAEGTPDWSGTYTATVYAANQVFAVSRIDSWVKTGTIESPIFDTTLASPAYNQIKWSENKPAGTDVSAKARSDPDEYLSGAADWSAVGASTISGNGRYLQFLATLSTEPFWDSGTSTLSYADYITQQIGTGLPYTFPADSGVPYTTNLAAPWVDDIEIDWPGDERICTVTGYIAKKNDYGQAKVTIDGIDLVKILSVHVHTEKTSHGRLISEENYVEVEPRNTGK